VTRRRPEALPMPGGAQLFQRMFTRLGLHGRLPLFDVRFHPYANLTVTIRMKQETAYVRFSDVMSGAPLAVLEAAAAILLARMYRRRARRQWLEVFRDYSYHEETRAQLETVRRLRARHVRGNGTGQHHDLESLFEQLNAKYFESALPMPRIGWSGRAWRAQLGCFDPALQQIAINRRLDRADVPEFVVAYVMYHEMLHQKHPLKMVRCRLQSHSAEFRKEEKKFRDYEAAQRFLARR
jgi:hypothetical protein